MTPNLEKQNKQKCYWESKNTFYKCVEKIRKTGKFTITLDNILDLIKEVKKVIKKSISTEKLNAYLEELKKNLEKSKSKTLIALCCKNFLTR